MAITGARGGKYYPIRIRVPEDMRLIYRIREAEGASIVWVGQTSNPARRRKELRRMLKMPKAVFEAVEFVSLDAADEREAFWMRHYRVAGEPLRNTYEARSLDDGTKATLSKVNAGKKVSTLTREKIGAAHRGRRKNLSAAGLASLKAAGKRLADSMWGQMTAPERAVRVQQARDRWKDVPPDKRSAMATERNRAAWAAMTPEQREERGRRIREGLMRACSSEERSRRAAHANAVRRAKPPAD